MTEKDFTSVEMQLSASTTGDQRKLSVHTLSPGRKPAFQFKNLLTLSSIFIGHHQMLFLFSLCSGLCFPPLEEEIQNIRQRTWRQNSTCCCLLQSGNFVQKHRQSWKSQIFRQAHPKETQNLSSYCLITAVQSPWKEACHLAAWSKQLCLLSTCFQ